MTLDCLLSCSSVLIKSMQLWVNKRKEICKWATAQLVDPKKYFIQLPDVSNCDAALYQLAENLYVYRDKTTVLISKDIPKQWLMIQLQATEFSVF